jgi:hypothetical protein
MRSATLRRLVPMPTAAELDMLHQDQERRRAQAERDAEAARQWTAKMRGRCVTVLGHDGRNLYVKITRTHYGMAPQPALKRFARVTGYAGSHTYTLSLVYPTTATMAFLRFAITNGMTEKNKFYWSI